MNFNIGRKSLQPKIPLGKMGIVMAHDPNMAIEWLGQPVWLLRLSNICSHYIGHVMFRVVSCVNVLGHEGRWVS